MTAQTDRWIRRVTIGVLAAIAATVSYVHTHALVEVHGQPGWVAALTPLSVDGMIVAASTTLLAESRSGSRGGVMPWALRWWAAWRAWRRMSRWLSRRWPGG